MIWLYIHSLPAALSAFSNTNLSYANSLPVVLAANVVSDPSKTVYIASRATCQRFITTLRTVLLPRIDLARQREHAREFEDAMEEEGKAGEHTHTIR